MRLLVCGSREWSGSWEDIGMHFPDPPADEDVTIIHGACSRIVRGVQVSVDMLADYCARGRAFGVEAYPVDHAKDGAWPGSGPRRNGRMLRESKPDRALAFGPIWKKATPTSREWKTTGTGDMVHRLLFARLPVQWVASPGAEPIDLVAMPGPS